MTGTSYDDIEAVQEYRKRKLHENDSTLGEDASLEELQEEYMRISQQRWEYACQYHNYETYCFSRSVTVDQAKAVFFSIGENSEGENVAVAEIMVGRPDDRAGRTEDETVIVPDSVTMVTRETGKKSGRAVYYHNGLNGERYPHCARTAACNLYATAQTAGLGDPIDGGETACARTIHGGGNRKAICNGNYSNNSGTETLQKLVLSGKVTAGSIISEYTGNSGSGYHALTVVDVNRDEQGNIISYTVMDNNGGPLREGKSRIRVIDINDTSGIGGKKVLYTNTEKWAMDQYRAQMDGKSEEELRAMIEEAKRDTDTLIDSLAVQENILLNDRTYTSTCGGSQMRIAALEGQRLNLNTFYNNQYVEVANEYLATHPAEVEQEVGVGGERDVVLRGDSEVFSGEEYTSVEREDNEEIMEVDHRVALEQTSTMIKNIVSTITGISTINGENYEDNTVVPDARFSDNMFLGIEDRRRIIHSMDEQRVDAEKRYQQNASEIASGEYGNDEIGMGRSVAGRLVETSSLGGENPAQGEQTSVLEQAVEREITPAELKKITKMQGWFSRVKIDPALVDSMVEKYGVDVAYDLALTSMTNPAKVSNGTDGKWRNSKACLNYFLENEVADEVVANITGRSADDVAKARPYRKVEGIKVETEKPLFNNEIKLHLSPLADTVER
jgi:hypothetical protein